MMLRRSLLRSAIVRGLAAALALGCAAITGSSGGAALADALPQIRKTQRDFDAIKKNTVGIITGGPQLVYAKLGNDLIHLLDDRKGESLRLEVLLGSGSVKNLDDLWNLGGVSLAIVQGDVLAAYAANDQFGWLKQHIRYVSRLHTEVLHVFARKEILHQGVADVCALRGKRVNVAGTKLKSDISASELEMASSGSEITAQKVFNGVLGLGVTFDERTADQAIDDVVNGRVDPSGPVDAFVVMVGRQAPLFTDVRLAKLFAQGELVWLDVPRALLDQGCNGRHGDNQADAALYESAKLTSTDYPVLLPAGKQVDTIGVPAVLASYKYDKPRDPRTVATENFVQHFFQVAADPDKGLGHPDSSFDRNWCGVDLAQTVETWQRDDAAKHWLDANRQKAKPLPTRIECKGYSPASPKVIAAFCASRQDTISAFKSSQERSGHPLAPGSEAYQAALLDFQIKECML